MARDKLQDGDAIFLAGQNSSLAPDQLLPSFYARGMNVVNRGGVVQCRPGYRCLARYPDGNFQGGALFKPKQGLASILFVVEGVLYLSEFPFRDFRPLPGVAFSPTAREIFFKQVEQSVRLNDDGSLALTPPKNLMVIQDGGTSPAVVFDGTRATAQTGDGKIPTGGPMEWVADRLWVARGAKLFASDIANPTSFTESVYLATVDAFILPGTITALSRTPSAAQSQLLVFTQTSTTLIQAGIRDRTLWPVTQDFQKEIFPQIGCVSQKSVTTHYGFLWWFSQHGLMSLDGAAQTFVTSELNYTDAEMTDSKARLSSDLAGIACSTYENYLLVSVPNASKYNTHTWVLDNTVLLSGKSTAPSWNGYWTGTRPVQWISASINGVNRSLYFSADYDGGTRLWEAFTPDRLDDGCPITWWVETRGLNFGAVAKTKEFRYADLFVSELAGEVDFAVFWAGASRGKYKRVLTKRVNATRGVWRSGEQFSMADKLFALKKQSRPLRTQDGRALIAEETQSSCDVEAPAEEFRDESFQLLLVGSGPGALRSYIQYVEPPRNTDDSGGGCPAIASETEENFVRFDGAAAESHNFREAFDDLMTSLPVFASVRTETVSRDGFTEIGMGSAESIISQEDADKIASAIAKRIASNRLEMSLPKIVSLGSTANERLDNSDPPDLTPGPSDGVSLVECACTDTGSDSGSGNGDGGDGGGDGDDFNPLDFPMDIYYTLDGSTPTSSSALFTGTPITLEPGQQLKLIAINGPQESGVKEAEVPTVDLVEFVDDKITFADSHRFSLSWGSLQRVDFGRLSEVISTIPFNGPTVGVRDCDAVEEVVYSALTVISNATFEVMLNESLATVAFPLLASLDDTFGDTDLKISSNEVLTSINLDALASVGGGCDLEIRANDILPTLALPALASLGDGAGLGMDSNPLLTAISLNASLAMSNNHSLNFSGCALDETTVDFILARAVAAASFVAGSIDLSGGTNAAPSVAGAADAATLTGRGISVTTN